MVIIRKDLTPSPKAYLLVGTRLVELTGAKRTAAMPVIHVDEDDWTRITTGGPTVVAVA